MEKFRVKMYNEYGQVVNVPLEASTIPEAKSNLPSGWIGLYKNVEGNYLLVCDDCESVENVSETTCPYVSELHGKDVDANLCTDCYHERLMDV